MILDVVYNHFGPDRKLHPRVRPQFLSTLHTTEWGEPFNFDVPTPAPCAEFFVANAAYSTDEYHIDGLRLDATEAIVDDSPEHILAAISCHVRESARGRAVSLWARTNRRTRTSCGTGRSAGMDSTHLE